ncbi:glycosyltransferase family 9 protein [Thorsellia anophelis]|uniref:Uncharacterized protein n=1 Tax=Thorsellia anophelis DSM 18579 TaxID=1123402 RepID=A0A1I0FXG6_9GAMM|nr:glycosyltransferase family 9 protein [Thorsellia anophelis]SET63248.1 hypothetical protein SAMN02583745_02932 [Thorsellia anophelis DSM 18579]
MNKILVVRLDFIGDLIVTTAFIDALHKQYPSAQTFVGSYKLLIWFYLF